jgi:hypothetical protein
MEGDPKKWWRFVLEPPEKDPIAELIKLAQDPAVKVTGVFPPRKSGEA